MLHISYRGYGQAPQIPEGNAKHYAELMFLTTLDLFMNLSQIAIPHAYETYNGKDDLYSEDGKINKTGDLTAHLKKTYLDIIRQCNLGYKMSVPPLDIITKFDILPDLNFAAVLKDGTVMCLTDKE